jgi:type II secretory pathway component GspD/PulD (secretin)
MRAHHTARALCAALILAAAGALAQELEILQLRNRTAEQVLPVLRPLLEPGGAITGQGYQLFVRTSARNLAEIRAVLESLDRPLRRLVISVRHGGSAEEARRGVASRIELRSGDSRAQVRIEDSRSVQEERVDQRVHVLEGSRARIAAGEARPLEQRRVVRTPDGRVIHESTTVIEQATTGLEVVPRVSGETVHLEITPQREAFAPGGAIRGERASTVVSGRLGEWIEVGGTAASGERGERGILSAREARSSAGRGIWLKVEELRN